MASERYIVDIEATAPPGKKLTPNRINDNLYNSLTRQGFTGVAVKSELVVVPPPPVPVAKPVLGISPGGNFQNLSYDTLKRELDLYKEANCKFLRVDINWAQIQAGGSGSWNWTADQAIQLAQERGIQIFGVLVYTPSWARPAGTSATHMPNSVSDYAKFAKAAAVHYKGVIKHWEIWNEPNIISAFTPKPDAAKYASLASAAIPAIKSEDPSAKVVIGATSPAGTDGTQISPADFIARVLGAGVTGFDAVSHHPYCWMSTPYGTEEWNAWYQMKYIRQALASKGVNCPIWITEYGAPTNGPSHEQPVTEDKQALLIKQAYEIVNADLEDYGPIFVYSGRNNGTDVSTRENFFGMLRYDFSKKPSFETFKTLANA